MKSSNYSLKRLFSAPIAVVALVVGGSVGVGVGLALTSAQSAPSSATGTSTYPTNASGETFGSALAATSLASEPDLILTTASNGQVGYMYKTDLQAADGSNVNSLQQAAAWDAERASVSEVITVYAEDGVTKVGTFTITPGVGMSPSLGK
jgi:hypothetical protein